MSLRNAYNSVKRALSTALPNDTYLRWDATGLKTPKPNKDKTARNIRETINKMQQYNFD
jgi:hypothetical protein